MLLFQFVPHSPSPPCPQGYLLHLHLEPVIQSDVSQREKQILCINAYTWNLEKWYWWMLFHFLIYWKQNRQEMGWVGQGACQKGVRVTPTFRVETQKHTWLSQCYKNNQLCIDRSVAYIKATTPGPDLSNSFFLKNRREQDQVAQKHRNQSTKCLVCPSSLTQILNPTQTKMTPFCHYWEFKSIAILGNKLAKPILTTVLCFPGLWAFAMPASWYWIASRYCQSDSLQSNTNLICDEA